VPALPYSAGQLRARLLYANGGDPVAAPEVASERASGPFLPVRANRMDAALSQITNSARKLAGRKRRPTE